MDNNRIKTINTKKPYYYQDMIYYTKNGNKDLKTINPTTKNIYKKIIQQGTKQHKIAGETLWKKHLPIVEWIWKNMEKYIHIKWPILQINTPFKKNKWIHAQMHKRHKSKMWPLQIYRRKQTSFTKCQRIWTLYQPILTKLAGKNYNPQEHLLTLSVSNVNKHTIKLTLTIIQIIIHEIWESRNNNNYDKTLIPQHAIITKINAQLRNIIQTHYKYNKLNDTINAFEELFCIKQAIAKKLKITI